MRGWAQSAYLPELFGEMTAFIVGAAALPTDGSFADGMRECSVMKGWDYRQCAFIIIVACRTVCVARCALHAHQRQRHGPWGTAGGVVSQRLPRAYTRPPHRHVVAGVHCYWSENLNLARTA